MRSSGMGLMLVTCASCALGPAAQAETAFFRVQAEAVISQFTPEGVLSWTNVEPGTTLQIQRAETLSDWQDYAEVAATGSQQSARVVDFAAPEDMVLIPAGLFTMGATTNMGHEGYANELPQHSVQVESFYLERYEVSKARWDAVARWAADHGYDLETTAADGRSDGEPVIQINWYQCLKWCNARSEMEGLGPCYLVGDEVYRVGEESSVALDAQADGYRLPTEAEWEKAARGGARGHRFPWRDADEVQHQRANYFSFEGYAYDTSPTRSYNPASTNGCAPYTSPVGSFPANGYGLYDMAGNVWEWCWDAYAADYYRTSPTVNPRGVSSSRYRVIRGGSWGSGPDGIRIALRSGNYPTQRTSALGFRCARRAGAP